MYKLAIKRPITTFMFAVALILFGLFALQNIPKSLFPDIDFPVVVVKTIYKGASSETIETKVTDKVEQSVMGIDGIKKVTSQSYNGISVVIVEFQLEKPINEAINDVRDKVSSIILDNGIDTPTVQKVDTGSTPIVSLFLSSKTHSFPEMMKHADSIILPMLQKIGGVGNVLVNGYRQRQIRIFPDPTLLNKYGLTYAQVANAISMQNIEIDSGRLVANKRDFSITTDSNIHTIEDIKNILIKNGLRIKDIAKVEDGLEEEKTFASFDGNPGVIFEVQKIAGANEIAIADGVKEILDDIRLVSPGYEVVVFRDTTDYIRSSIEDIEFDLVLGAFLAVFVVFLFLRNLTITIVSAISIPVSVLATFALVSAVGFTLNMMTLIALTLSIGIIIDDAIVVIENIHKKLEQGLPKREAAYEGVREIGFAIIAISMMLLSVFVPVGTMSGIIGKFFTSFGLTVAIAVCISYLVVVTVIPMFSSLLVSANHSKFYYWSMPFFNWLDNAYLKTVGFVMKSWKHMIGVLIVVFGIFICSLYIANTLGSEFILKEDRSEFLIGIKAKPGISIAEMKRITNEFKDIIKDNEHVLYATLQVGPGDLKAVYFSKIFVKLKPLKYRKGKDEGQFQIMKSLASKIRSMPDSKGMFIFASEVPLVGGGTDNTPFQVNVFAPQKDLIKESIDKLQKFILTYPGFKDKITNFHLNASDVQPQYRLTPIKQSMARYGITSTDIGMALNAAFSGEGQIAYYREQGKEYDITIRVPDDKRISIKDIKRIQVLSSSGHLIFIDGLVSIEESATPSSISRYNRQRSITLAAEPIPGSGLSLGDMISTVEEHQSEWLVPGVGYSWGGQADSQAQSAKAFRVAIMMAFVLIYLILAALYESFLQPIIIMVTMPLSFSGGFFAIKLAGMPFSIFATMGLILLIGMVGKNATLLVDVANEKRKEGMSLVDSIKFAGEARLRPILMTTIAMVAGMLPLLLATGDGSAMKQPIGLIMVGGLMVSMILSLLVVPIFYRIITPIDEKLQKFYKPKPGDKF